MTAGIVERALDNRAITLIRDQLASGGGLARALRQQIDIASGTLSTFVDEGTVKDLYDWRTGGKLEQPTTGVKVPGGVAIPKRDADAAVVKALFGTSENDGVSLVVSENTNARRGDLWILKSLLRHAFMGEEVFNVATPKEGELEVLESVSRTKTSWYELSVWRSACRPSWLEFRAELSESDLAQIAAETRYLMVGAYDGESYVVWRRANLRP